MNTHEWTWQEKWLHFVRRLALVFLLPILVGIAIIAISRYYPPLRTEFVLATRMIIIGGSLGALTIIAGWCLSPLFWPSAGRNAVADLAEQIRVETMVLRGVVENLAADQDALRRSVEQIRTALATGTAEGETLAQIAELLKRRTAPQPSGPKPGGDSGA